MQHATARATHEQMYVTTTVSEKSRTLSDITYIKYLCLQNSRPISTDIVARQHPRANCIFPITFCRWHLFGALVCLLNMRRYTLRHIVCVYFCSITGCVLYWLPFVAGRRHLQLRRLRFGSVATNVAHHAFQTVCGVGFL